MSHFLSRCRQAVGFLLVCLLVTAASTARAQDSDSTMEGYVQSLRSLYAKPDATSNTIGFIEPGEYVRLEHVSALVYKVFRNGEQSASGYVVYPKVGPTSPLNKTATPVRAASEAASKAGNDPRSIAGEDRWVHNFSNIRLHPNATASVVAQLPPGARVVAGDVDGTWTLVFRQDETRLDPARALGYVHSSLLFSSPPLPGESPTAPGAEGTTDEQTRGNSVQSIAAVDSRVNVNTADQRMLETLPRIGPVLAKRIIDYRTANGEFRRVEDLVNVKGIGEKTLERLMPYVTVDG